MTARASCKVLDYLASRAWPLAPALSGLTQTLSEVAANTAQTQQAISDAVQELRTTVRELMAQEHLTQVDVTQLASLRSGQLSMWFSGQLGIAAEARVTSLLEAWLANRPSTAAASSAPAAGHDEAGADVYTVDRLLAQRWAATHGTKYRRREFLVRWLGWGKVPLLVAVASLQHVCLLVWTARASPPPARRRATHGSPLRVFSTRVSSRLSKTGRSLWRTWTTRKSKRRSALAFAFLDQTLHAVSFLARRSGPSNTHAPVWPKGRKNWYDQCVG